MRYDHDVVQQKELAARATARIAWAIASDSWHGDDPIAAMRERGHGRYLPTAFSTKAAVSPITTADTAVALLPLDTAFLGLVDAESLLGQLDGSTRIPVTAAARLQVGTIVGADVPEAGVKPVARLDFSVADDPVKVSAQVVASNDAMRSIDPVTQDGIRQVLVSAVATATDAALVATLTAGPPSGAATPAALLSSGPYTREVLQLRDSV